MALPRTDRSSSSPEPTAGRKLLERLQGTGFVGMWKDRTDMEDSSAYVQRLRKQMQVRADGGDPAK